MRDGIGQSIPPITATLRVPREPLESLGKSISTSPVPSYPLLEACWEHVTDWTTEGEARRRIAFATCASQETPSEGEETRDSEKE